MTNNIKLSARKTSFILAVSCILFSVIATYLYINHQIDLTRYTTPIILGTVVIIITCGGLQRVFYIFLIVRWGSDVAPTGDKLLMQKGDVLFGKRRAYQRKVGIAPFDGIFSAHGMVLRPNTEIIDANYFPFFISSDRFMETAVRISVGGLSPTINWKDLAKQEFDLPPLEEQKVLADKLWAAYRLKEGYKKLLAATDEMVKSQFIEMFSSYQTTPVGNYIEDSYPGEWGTEDKDGNGVKVVRTTNFTT